MLLDMNLTSVYHHLASCVNRKIFAIFYFLLKKACDPSQAFLFKFNLQPDIPLSCLLLYNQRKLQRRN